MQWFIGGTILTGENFDRVLFRFEIRIIGLNFLFVQSSIWPGCSLEASL